MSLIKHFEYMARPLVHIELNGDLQKRASYLISLLFVYLAIGFWAKPHIVIYFLVLTQIYDAARFMSNRTGNRTMWTL